MSKVILKIENLSKQYRLGVIGTGTIRDDLKRWWYKLRGKEDPFQKIGDENDRSKKAKSSYVWALKDINFEVKKGEVLGVIGKNGAGKSTLLKILSKITSPTTGNIKSKGTVASLLEVGTGFHGELTGRENIYLNGTILGMTKKEIASKIDEIIEFSGCERYINTPVKRYSSGMTVRLAFAVAAFLEPDILIIDEVLAVGDAEFQKKAIGKMQDISRGEGRTVLLVSHNMGIIQKLCSNSILLNNGKVIMKGKTEKVIDYYLSQSILNNSEYLFEYHSKNYKKAFSTKLRIEDLNGNLMDEIPIGKPWRACLYFTLNEPINNLVVGLGMTNMYDLSIRTSWTEPESLAKGNYLAIFEEKKIKFNSGQYKLLVGLSKGSEVIEYINNDIFVVISDVVHNQHDTVKNNKSGLIANQMQSSIVKTS